MHEETGGAYVAKVHREALLIASHGAASGGHFSNRATFKKLEGKAWWPGMRQDAYELCRVCGACQRNKQRNNWRNRWCNSKRNVSQPGIK